LEHIHAIDEYIRSAKMLTDQLLGFARGGKYQVKPIDMNDLVRKTATMFGRTKKELQIHIRLNDTPIVVEADANQIEQVLLNLYINAWQAMPEGGELFLDAGIVVPDDDFCGLYQTTPAPYARITVTDTGIGMNEATLKRVFDPFFTTKEKGRGTGLGLASAYGIIRNHGGVITVQSKPGAGSTFAVYLPASNGKALQVGSREAELKRGSGTILLVDDEAMILDVGQAMLKHLGYHVVVAKDGKEAVETVKLMGNEIDLVILDFIMPGMDGGKTFNHIREISPGMPVMLSSGYGSNRMDHMMRAGRSSFIQKPFTMKELYQNILIILDRCPDSP
jgi:two-component system cell cycle sensor histidine kinase/response regulator CckA